MNPNDGISLFTPQQQTNESANSAAISSLTKITPIVASPMSRLVLSTGKATKRLSLSSRDKITKKRLNFLAPASSVTNLNKENCNSSEGLQTTLLPSQYTDDIQIEVLRSEIAIKRDELEIHQKHEQRVKELQSQINTWQQGFRKSLDSFKEKLNPPQDEKNILEYFQISESVLNSTKPNF